MVMTGALRRPSPTAQWWCWSTATRPQLPRSCRELCTTTDRATIVGNSNTFGKGRIQSVYELRDGSALFVTVANDVTPHGTEIDLKGIRPDTACGLGSAMLGDGPEGVAGIEDDGSLAAFLSGVPLGAGSEQAFVSALSRDRCVMTAMNVLKERTNMIQAAANVVANLPTRL